MSQVNFSSTSSVSFGELGPTTSLQLMFAKLQLELAETAKTQAMDKMDAIAKAQDEQKFVSQLLNEARQAKADANSGIAAGTQSETYSNGTTEKNTKNCTLMSKEMVDYMGQYNSYLQGANTQIANSNQTLTNLARGQ